MNILLVNSYCKFRFTSPLYPISLVYIGNFVLKETGASITVLDLNLYDRPLDKLKKTLGEKNPDIVGISIMSSSLYHFSLSSPISHILKICQVAKSYNSYIKLIVGGPWFSLFSDELMKLLPDIDVGIVGEGEEAFVEVIKNIENLNTVKGIYYRMGKRIVYSGDRSPMEPDKIPIPQNIFGIDLSKYDYIGVQTRRGCSFRCIYCPNEFLWGGQGFRLRPIKNIIEEIKFYKNLGINKIYFTDTLFNIPHDFARELIEEIIKNKLEIKWGSYFKPLNLDTKFLERVEKSGCRVMDLTADCGSNKILEVLKTKVTVKDILETAILVSRFKNISQAWYFMTGLPEETVITNFDKIKLILKLIKISVKPSYIFLAKLKYFPHTELNDLYSRGWRSNISISKPSIYYSYLLLDKDIYMTCLIGLFAIYRILKAFKRHAC